MKEGFLLYYPESENKVFERAHIFNIHPKVYTDTHLALRVLLRLYTAELAWRVTM